LLFGGVESASYFTQLMEKNLQQVRCIAGQITNPDGVKRKKSQQGPTPWRYFYVHLVIKGTEKTGKPRAPHQAERARKRIADLRKEQGKGGVPLREEGRPLSVSLGEEVGLGAENHKQ